MGMFLSSFANADLESTISDISTKTVLIGSVLLVLLVIAALLWSQRHPKTKAPIFGLILVVVLGTTLTISGGTIYLNVKSATGGPVHWHADVEFWACGNELELRDPQGVLSNKIGTPTLHEHNDKRIHLEGVPVELPQDASLGKFMDVVGGDVTNHTLIVPVNEGDDLFENGEGEEDGDGNGAPAPELVQQFLRTSSDGRVATFVGGQSCEGEPAEVQVFAYQLDETSKTYHQKKLDNPSRYEIGKHGEVPPGDCVIFEFAPPKDRTDKLCKQYGVRDIDRCEQFGVPASGRHVCEIREVR